MGLASRAFTGLLCLIPFAADGQSAPPGWRWQADRPGASTPAGTLDFQEMVPGMHVTSGVGGIFIAPGDAERGRFYVEAEVFVFPNSAADNRYGILIGGRREAGSSDSLSHWIGFLVSSGGAFSVVERTPSGMRTVLAPVRTDAVLTPKESNVLNRIRVAVDRDSLRFSANGKAVGAVARAGLEPEGLVGLRVEAGLNLHITSVDIARRTLRR
jgi:hypothetical protein